MWDIQASISRISNESHNNKTVVSFTRASTEKTTIAIFCLNLIQSRHHLNVIIR